MIIAERTYSLGKVDYWGRGRRRAHEVRLQIALRPRIFNGEVGFQELSICGEIWNAAHTDIESGGQNIECIEAILPQLSGKREALIEAMLPIWKKWHLNDMHAGTPEQEKVIHDHFSRYPGYDKACELLKLYDLYEVPYTGWTSSGYAKNIKYKYGHGWLVRVLPHRLESALKQLLVYASVDDISSPTLLALKRAIYADETEGGGLVC